LVNGLTSQLPNGTTLTGGLAGDGARFGVTLVFGESEPQKGNIAIVGLYGSCLEVDFSSMGGGGFIRAREADNEIERK